jgi:hypothetical protein
VIRSIVPSREALIKDFPKIGEVNAQSSFYPTISTTFVEVSEESRDTHGVPRKLAAEVTKNFSVELRYT